MAVSHRTAHGRARAAAGGLLSAAIAIGCGEPPPPPAPAPEAAAPSAAETPPPKAESPPATADKPDPGAFSSQLAAVDTELAARRELSDKSTNSWMAAQKVAGLYLRRARLSGSYDDYAEAERALAVAFERTRPGGSGPWLTRAHMNFSLHRFDRIEADLDRAEKRVATGREDARSTALLRANLAFERGQYAEAESALTELAQADPTLPKLSSLAQVYWKTARFDEAEALYRRALDAYHGRATEPRAWVHLQLGLMDLDRGRVTDALGHYHDAAKIIPGYWLIEEHIAEGLVLTRQPTRAEAMYRQIIDRTDNPEFMDALAELLQAKGDTEGAKALITRARARYDAQLARYPEAAYGHALDHWLAHEPDDAAVIELAEKNHALRPNADAKRLLAQAYLRAKRVDDAAAVVDAMLALPVRSAELHATAAEVLAAAGREDEAAAQREAARAIDPTAAD